MKRFFSILLCIALLTGALAVTAISASADDMDIADTGVSDTADLAETGSDTDLADEGALTDTAQTAAFTPVNIGDSFYARIRMISQKDYYVTSPQKADDVPVLSKLNGYNTQVWHFTRDGNAYRIRSVALNRYVEVYGQDFVEGGLPYFGAKSDLSKQKWSVSKDTTGYQIHCAANTDYKMVCVNPTSATSAVKLTAKNSSNSYFAIEKMLITADTLATPTLKLSNLVDGVKLDWNDVKYAAKYRVYRYNDTKKQWNILANVTKSEYTDKTAKSGMTNQYTVKVISPVLSGYKAASIRYIAAPAVSVSNNNKGPVISWKKVTGADQYMVFLHNGTKWKILGKTSDTTFLHEGFSYNTAYRYTVRCLSADGKTFTSAYDTTGVTNTIVKTPAVTTKIMPFSVDLTWKKVSGASKYRVYVRTAGSSWKNIADTEKVAYSYSNVVSNNGYYFTVRALDADGKLISGYTSSKLVTYYEAPCVHTITATSNTKKISWYPVDGASKYRIYAWNGQKWVNKGETEEGVTTFSASVSGTAKQNICYAVRCMDSKGNFISYYLETVIERDLRYYYPGEYTSTHKFTS